MVYKYVFVTGVNPYLFILITYDHVIFHKLGFLNLSLYQNPSLSAQNYKRQNSLLAQVQRISGSRVPLG